MKLVLFDIDGTVLRGGGAGKRAVTRALAEVYGSTGPSDHRFDGKTDPQIIRELMRHDGHPDQHIDGAVVGFRIAARDLDEQLIAGERPAGIAHERAEQRELGRGQRDLTPLRIAQRMPLSLVSICLRLGTCIFHPAL